MFQLIDQKIYDNIIYINSPPTVSRATQTLCSSSPHRGATYDPILIAGSVAKSPGDSSMEEMAVVPSRCLMYNYKVPFKLSGAWEKVVAYSDHMSRFDHSSCSPFLNMAQKAGYLKTMAKLSIAQACPQCGMPSKVSTQYLNCSRVWCWAGQIVIAYTFSN